MIEYFHRMTEMQKCGHSVGTTSICSANPFVLRAALEHAGNNNRWVCIESTGRQVNQDGGYAGMTPKTFAGFVRKIAGSANLPENQVILGGDHLGPGAWRSENADTAMAKACELIRQCIDAGYQKLHLDPSMPCKDDVRAGHPGLRLDTIADRTALLCQAAETAAADNPGNNRQPVYIVGAEVPIPGGINKNNNEIRVSSAEDVEETVRTMRDAFIKRGLSEAWNRCIAVVVETGATFGPEKIIDYSSAKTRDLTAFITSRKNLVYEAHSTDFQAQTALSNMVRDHFAILKAGPCLTFAAREALFALAAIEHEWLGSRKRVRPSQLQEVMHGLMRKNQTLWQDHYSGSDAYLGYITAFGFSDRIRYFWSHPESKDAVTRLFENLTLHGIPLPLLSQFMPEQFEAVREGIISCSPEHLVNHKIMKILDRYANACGEQIRF